MAKEKRDSSYSALKAEMAELRHRIARLEAIIRRMLGADGGERPAPSDIPAARDEAPPAATEVPPPPTGATAPEDEAPAPVGVDLPAAAEVTPPVTEVAAAAEEATAPRAASRPGSLEQTIGMRWLLFVGVGVLLLSAVFFFRYAIEQGWIGPRQRVIVGALTGLAMLGGAEWAFRRGMRLYAGAIAGAGIALLYIVVFVASLNGLYADLNMLGKSMTVAFMLMCVVTLLGVAAALRSSVQPMAIISLLGALATPVLLSSARDRQVVLMTYLLIVDAGFLVIAWSRAWRALAPLALAGTGVLFALWFDAHYPSATLGWSVTSAFGWAFFALFVGYAAGGAARGRIVHRRAMAIASVAATAMLLLWVHQQLWAAYAAQLLVLNIVVLALCAWLDWRPIPPAAMAVTGVMFMMRFAITYGPEELGATATCAFAWAFFILFVAYAAAGSVLGRTSRKEAVATTSIAAGAMVLLWLCRELHTALAAQLLALNAVVLALCLKRHWHRLRLGVLAWTMVAMAAEWAYTFTGYGSLGPVSWSVWAWALFALVTVDVMLRAWRRDLPRVRRLEPVLASLAMAAMFGGTYGLLDISYHAWMGLYAAVLGAGAIVAGWAVTTRGRWGALGYAYFAQAFVLLALAVPIQFDLSMVTIAWAVQGLVAMVLARRLGSWALMGKSVALFLLAVLHFLIVALDKDDRLAATAFSCGGVDISLALLLATGLTASILAAVAALRAGKAIRDDLVECGLAGVLAVGAAVFFFAMCGSELPPTAATWWWMALTAGMAAWGLGWRSDWLTGTAGPLVLACAAKWLMFDTLNQRIESGPDVGAAVVMNWQFWTGLAAAALALAYALVLERRRVAIMLDGSGYERGLSVTCIVLACVIVAWAGSFEIDRFFAGASPHEWSNLDQARHMTFSLWWAVWAAVVLVTGFVASRPPLRYLAFAIFAVTLGKVFIVDMQQVKTVYRILSFLGLGVTLLGGALLYHRRFATPRQPEPPTEPPPAPPGPASNQ